MEAVMSKYVRLCPNCKSKSNENSSLRGCGYSTFLEENEYICEVCGKTVTDLKMLTEDYRILIKVSPEPKFMESMIQLQETDIVEYNLKMSQFRTQVQQQENSRAQAANTVKCPRCGSTNITAGQRGFSLLTGFVGSGKTVNRCANCGHKWRP